MREHLSAANLEQFVLGDYPVSKIVEISKHIAECLRCKKELGRISPDFIDQISLEKSGEHAAAGGEHFSKSEMISFLKSELPVKTRLEMSEHFRECGVCKKTLYAQDPAFLKRTISTFLEDDEIEQKKPYFPKLSVLVPAGALAGLLIIAFLALMFIGFNREKDRNIAQISNEGSPDPPRSITAQEAKTPVKEDGNAIINEPDKTTRENINLGQDSTSARQKTNEISRAGLSSKKKVEERKQSNKRRRLEIANSRSTNSAAENSNGVFTALSPKKGSVTENQPTFRWKPISNAIKYNLYVSDDSQVLIEEGETKKKTSYKLKTSLKSGGNYQWRVITTLVNGKTINSGAIKFSAKEEIQNAPEKSSKSTPKDDKSRCLSSVPARCCCKLQVGDNLRTVKTRRRY